MSLELPGSNGPKNYVESVEVNFKPKTGTYVYWDGEKQVETKTLAGVVVYTAFQFMADRIVSKSRSDSYVSDPFTFDEMKEGAKKITVKRRTRTEGEGTKYEKTGEFSYAQIKSPEFAAQLKINKFRMFNVVYLYDADKDTLMRIQFSPVVGRIVSKGISKDQPNFITLLGVTNEIAISDDNGDYYAPTFAKNGASPLDKVVKISEKIQEIHRIVTKAPISNGASAPSSNHHSNFQATDCGTPVEDLPFGN